MSKTVLLTACLLLSTAWVVAQQSSAPDTSGSSQTGATTASSSQSGTSSEANANTIQGCLNGSSGNFTLTDKSGTTYQLAGKTSDLSKHVGEEVSIHGSQSSAASGSASANAGSAIGSARTSPSAGASSSANQTPINATGVTKHSRPRSIIQKSYVP